MDSKPTNRGLPSIPEQTEEPGSDEEGTSSVVGKTDIRTVTRSKSKTPALDIPGGDPSVVRRTSAKRSGRPETYFDGASPFDEKPSTSPTYSMEDSPSSFRSRSKTISSGHSSEIEELCSQLGESSRQALENMRQTSMTIQEFTQALINVSEDSEDTNADDVTLPEARHHQIMDHCDLTSEKSLLNQCLPAFQLQASDLQDYEKEQLSHLACRHLAQLPPDQLEDSNMVEQSLTAVIAHYTSCFQKLLPETSNAVVKETKALTIPCEASFKVAIRESGKDPDKDPFLELIYLIQATLTVLHTSCYRQLVKNGYRYNTVIAETRRLIKAWKDLETRIPGNPDILMAGLKADRAKALETLQQHQDMLQTLKKNDFRSINNVMRSVTLINSAALSLIQEAEIDHPESSSTYTKLQKHITQLHQYAAEHPPEENTIACLRGYKSRVKAALSKVRIQDYDKALALTLKNNCARPYKKKLALCVNGQPRNATVEYTPAACVRVNPPEEDLLEDLATQAAGTCDPFKNPYHGKFCPSVQRDEPDHCVNLMLMTVTLDDEPPATACFYKEIRVGIPYPFAVSDSRRNTTEETRWDEILTAALIQNQPQDLQDAMTNPNHAPLELPVMYNCLLSPDKGRPLVKALPFIDPEITWCRRTRDKIKQINQQGIRELTVHDSNGIEHPVRVIPKVIMAINPCNEMAFGPAFSKAGTWLLADEVTAELLTAWLGPLNSRSEPTGETGEFLRRKDVDPLIQQEVRELALEIRQTFFNQQHRKLSLQPFLFSNMISELGRLLGYANVTGCKSAKDRTGEKSETDIKFSFDCYCAREANRRTTIKTSIIPYLWMALTEADHFNALQCNLNSGQEENCQNNTGIPGRKVPGYMLGLARENYDAIHFKRFGGVDRDWLKPMPHYE